MRIGREVLIIRALKMHVYASAKAPVLSYFYPRTSFIEISNKITHSLNHSHHTLPLQHRLTRTASEFLISAKKRLVNQKFAHKNNGGLSHTRSNQTSLFETDARLA